jgi:hypothetical protein
MRHAGQLGLTMPLLIIGIVIGFILFSLYRTYAPSSGLRLFEGDTHIVIDDGTLRVRRGFVPAPAMGALADILRNAGVSSGHITLSKDRRVVVSWDIPPALHQNIRNVLLLNS